MRNSRRFVAVAALWALVPAPATAEVSLFGLFHNDVDAVKPLRPPKPGEHLGEYLIAKKLPPRYPLSLEPQWPAPESLAAALKSRGVPIIPWANGIAPPGAVPL